MTRFELYDKLNYDIGLWAYHKAEEGELWGAPMRIGMMANRRAVHMIAKGAYGAMKMKAEEDEWWIFIWINI